MGIPSRQIGWGTTENLLWQIAKHMKRFAFDDAYYNLYWAAVEAAERRERESAASEQA